MTESPRFSFPAKEEEIQDGGEIIMEQLDNQTSLTMYSVQKETRNTKKENLVLDYSKHVNPTSRNIVVQHL